jgi:hypothetical protein
MLFVQTNTRRSHPALPARFRNIPQRLYPSVAVVGCSRTASDSATGSWNENDEP